MLKRAAGLALLLALGACATPQPPRSGFLTRYDGMAPKQGTLRVAVRQRADRPVLAHIRRVAIDPPVYASAADTSWMSDDQRVMLLREVSAQLCFELSKYYDIVPPGQADARVRAAVTGVRETGRASSMASAAAGLLIPGPFNLRPGSTGGLTAEAEMLNARNRQVAAIVFARRANTIGTDEGSLSRVGDAMQFAAVFGKMTAREFRPRGAVARRINDADDPCEAYGARFRPAGFVTRMATGLYSPEMSAAKAEAPPAAPASATAPDTR